MYSMFNPPTPVNDGDELIDYCKCHINNNDLIFKISIIGSFCVLCLLARFKLVCLTRDDDNKTR